MHVCPECKRIVKWVGIDLITDSFFKSLGKSFLYPFALQPMIVLGVLTFIGMFLTKNIVINEILFAIIWLCLISYSQSVVDNTLKGRDNPPKFTAVPIPRIMNHIYMMLKQSLLYLIICTLFILSTEYFSSTLISSIVLVVSALILPFGLMKSITAGTFKKFIDPGSFFKILKKTGPNYFVLSALFIPVITLFHSMLAYQPKIIIPVVCFLMMVLYRMIGQMILKCHEELGYSVDFEHFKKMISLESMHGFKA